jgi:uncharacterized protein (TIGR00661 family)
MKILYAASNNHNARIQLARFLSFMDGHQIKVAAYKKSSPKNINIDWCLDALLNVYKPELLSLKNDNLNIYFEQVKDFAPDLIISDLEYFTSYIANVLNIRLWQCSSSLLKHALTWKEKYDLGLFKYYAYALNRDPEHTQRMVNLIDNSERNLVYSHYGETEHPPILEPKFEWVRPYHQVSKPYPTCQHHIVAGLYGNNKQIINVLKKQSDSVIFTESRLESYPNLLVKDIDNQEEYYCNLRNSNLFVCQGQASFLADAFYNEKFSLIYPDYEDTESIINSQLSRKLKHGHIMTYDNNIAGIEPVKVEMKYQDSIKYLHEKIKEIE